MLLAATNTASSTASIVTAISTIVIGIGGILGTILGLIPYLKNLRKNVGEVHTMVNQQRTDLVRYQAVLVQALEIGGVKVPVDQSQPILAPVETKPTP